jgi:hypothetical protein
MEKKCANSTSMVAKSVELNDGKPVKEKDEHAVERNQRIEAA